jgi:type VI secretion system protein ImpH
MPATQRRFEPSVIQQLLDEPYRFQFFQAVRLLELWMKRNGIPHGSAVADYLRFKNTVSLNFPPSELEALTVDPKAAGGTAEALLAALQAGTLNHIDITPSFMGFLGSNGVLPAHYTERIAAHLMYERDEAPRAFLDVFSNRSVALFYEAWRKYRLEFKYEISGKDRFLPVLLSLAGFGHSALQGKLNDEGRGVCDQSIGYFAAAVRHRPVSAAYMQRVLSEYFSVPITIEQFVGTWYGVPATQQTRLGEANAILGSLAMVGERVWQRDLRLRLTVGPLDKKNFDEFLPGGAAAKSLEKMLVLFTSVCLEYEINLIFRKQDVRGIRLSSDREGGRLGHDAFLTAVAQENDRADVHYEIHALQTQ